MGKARDADWPFEALLPTYCFMLATTSFAVIDLSSIAWLPPAIRD